MGNAPLSFEKFFRYTSEYSLTRGIYQGIKEKIKPQKLPAPFQIPLFSGPARRNNFEWLILGAEKKRKREDLLYPLMFCCLFP